jgi:hypothetical protein
MEILKIMEQLIKTFRVWPLLLGLCGLYAAQKSCQMVWCWSRDKMAEWEYSLSKEEQYWNEIMKADSHKNKISPD